MSVHVLDDFLTEDDIHMFLNLEQKGGIYKKPELCRRVAQQYKERLAREAGVEITSDQCTVGITPTPMRRHTDQRFGNETAKVLIYLNSVDKGGTVFWIGNTRHLIENKRNRCVVFDISLQHESEAFVDNTVKRTIGFRAQKVST